MKSPPMDQVFSSVVFRAPRAHALEKNRSRSLSARSHLSDTGILMIEVQVVRRSQKSSCTVLTGHTGEPTAITFEVVTKRITKHSRNLGLHITTVDSLDSQRNI